MRQHQCPNYCLRCRFLDGAHRRFRPAGLLVAGPGLTEQRYRDLLAAVLPAGYQGEDSHRARWLWRTLRSAELAGLDPAEVLRDVAAVLDSRIRRTTRALVPLAPRPWAEQVPALADPARRDYVAQVARLTDERAERIGEHAAEHDLPWAVAALGPVPEDPPVRLDWQRRPSAIGAYREQHGWDHPAEPIGPEPGSGDPDKRAAWHHALAALGPAHGEDVRGLPDGMLLHLRDIAIWWQTYRKQVSTPSPGPHVLQPGRWLALPPAPRTVTDGHSRVVTERDGPRVRAELIVDRVVDRP